MNLDDVRTLVQAVDARTVAQPLLLPGTVGQVEGGGLVEVVMDSDPDGTSIEASCLFADVGEGDRVMVLFDPPRGVYAVGLIGRTVEAGQLVTVLTGSVSGVAYTSGQTTVLDVDTSQVSLRANRFYDLRLNLGIDFDTVDTDPVEVTATINFTSFPTTSGLVAYGNVWGSVNAALVGGNVGTLNMERVLSLTGAWADVLNLTVSVTAVTGPGDVDLSYELAVFDAGPVSAVS